MSARLRGALSRNSKTRLGSLVAHTGERTKTEEETLDLLLATHFPDSAAVEGVWNQPLLAAPQMWTGG